MTIRKNKRDSGGAETSALNDILFILLFFFLIIATMANPNVIKLSLPKAASNDRAKQTVVVSIDAQQRFYVNTKPTPEGVLQSAIATILQKDEDAQPTIVINADKQAIADNIVAVMRVAHALHVRTVLAVAKEND